jgi:hypothetical protein
LCLLGRSNRGNNTSRGSYIQAIRRIVSFSARRFPDWSPRKSSDTLCYLVVTLYTTRTDKGKKHQIQSNKITTNNKKRKTTMDVPAAAAASGKVSSSSEDREGGGAGGGNGCDGSSSSEECGGGGGNVQQKNSKTTSSSVYRDCSQLPPTATAQKKAEQCTASGAAVSASAAVETAPGASQPPLAAKEPTFVTKLFMILSNPAYEGM